MAVATAGSKMINWVIYSGGGLHTREEDWREWKKRQTRSWERRVAAMRNPSAGCVCRSVVPQYTGRPGFLLVAHGK